MSHSNHCKKVITRVVEEHLLKNCHRLEKNINFSCPSELLNLYLFGSRLYGCHTSDSDYDFIAIVNTKNYFDGTELIEFHTEMIEGIQYNLNINVYHIKYFEECLIPHQYVWALLCCFIEKDFIYKEQTKLNFHLNVPKLKSATLQDTSHNFQKSKRLWSEGNLKVSKKNIVHGIRHCQLAMQLLKHGRIMDFQCANQYHHQVFSTKPENDNWNYYDKIYRPIIGSMMHDLRHFELKLEYPIASPAHPLQTLAYIHKHGLFSLQRDYAIKIYYPFPQTCPNLILLTKDQTHSPLESRIVQECTGLLIEDKDLCQKNEEASSIENLCEPKYSLVAANHSHIFKYSNENLSEECLLPRIDWKNLETIRVFEKLDGLNVTLFHYKNQWRVISMDTYKSEYRRLCTTNIAQFIKFQRPDQARIEQMFWEQWNKLGYKFPPKEVVKESCENLCFGFEMVVADMSPKPQVVQIDNSSQKEGLYLFFVLNRKSLTEMDSIQVADTLGYRHVTNVTSQIVEDMKEKQKIKYHTKKIKKHIAEVCTDRCRSIDPMELEGFILQDTSTLNAPLACARVQFISPQYLTLKSFAYWETLDVKTREHGMLQLVRTNQVDNFLKFKNAKWNSDKGFLSLYQDTKQKYEAFISCISNLYESILSKSKDDMQIFNQECSSFEFYYVFYDFKNYNSTPRQFFSFCHYKKLLKVMNQLKHWENNEQS